MAVVAPQTPAPQAQPERELRCWRCGRLLARVVLLLGCRVAIKCRDCKALNVAAMDRD